MGYTHYWNSTNFTDEQWKEFTELTEKVVNECVFVRNIMLDIEFDDQTQGPDINDSTVVFNGRDDLGHETFYFEKTNSEFAFCKTASKPYDAAVVACLILAHHCNPDFSWRSDGSVADRDFDEAIDLVSKVLGKNIDDIGLDA